ncbi:hypothetical protein DFH08DRAFT_699449 [Mycena albidolilacea]|uniref:Uncharacterized protein n=1 Tax=Mycena albidolilacea TaxID=1033008 RepID=A0AAD7EQV2_9AGAR|nr:hypothetical protein DFH08DRAFT_699449 [Mycena albidolilacea]
MLQAAKNYHLEFTALSILRDIQLQMPLWNYIALIGLKFEKICRKDAVKCLLQNHQVRNLADTVKIAGRKTILSRHPHLVNPSDIGRRNCGCLQCKRDRVEYGCQNPGECIEATKILLECIQPKWNPMIENRDLCDELALSEQEKSRNDNDHEGQDTELTFDPNF